MICGSFIDTLSDAIALLRMFICSVTSVFEVDCITGGANLDCFLLVKIFCFAR